MLAKPSQFEEGPDPPSDSAWASATTCSTQCRGGWRCRSVRRSISVHNPTEGFLTGSSDGCLVLWDVFNRTKTSTFEKGGAWEGR